MDDLDRLFSEYRNAFSDVDASGDFTPGIWRKIEARRPPARFMLRVTEAFVALSLALALMIGLFVIPRLQSAPVYSATYVDVLAADRADMLDLADEGMAQ